MANFEQTAEHIGETFVKDRTAWYILGGLLVIGYIIYQFYANAQNSGGSVGTASNAGSTGGTVSNPTGTGSTVDTTAQTNADNLSYQQSLEALQEKAANFNYGLTKQTNADTLSNTEALATFNTANSNAQANNALATYENQKTFDTTNALNFITGTNAAQEDLARVTNQITNQQTIDAANAQVAAATSEYNFLYTPNTADITSGHITSNASASHIPDMGTTSSPSWIQIKQALQNGGGTQPSVATNNVSGVQSGNQLTTNAPTSGAANYQSNATQTIGLPDYLQNTRFGTLFTAGQAQAQVSTAQQEAIANNNTKNSVTAYWESSNANAEHSNALNNGNWFGTAVGAITGAITGNAGSVASSTARNGGSIGSWLSSIFSFQPHTNNGTVSTPTYIPTNNGGNDYSYPGQTNTPFSGLADLPATFFDNFA